MTYNVFSGMLNLTQQLNSEKLPFLTVHLKQARDAKFTAADELAYALSMYLRLAQQNIHSVLLLRCILERLGEVTISKIVRLKQTGDAKFTVVGSR